MRQKDIHMKNYTAQNIVLQQKGKWFGQYGLCRCPAHDDYNPSLSITEKDGRILWHCFAGCSQQEVYQALILANLLPINGGSNGK